jgi:uncharacterized protein
MKSFYLRSAVVWLAAVGVGCTSVPVHYYTLIPPPEKALPASKSTLAVDVRVVHTPPQINRAELMVRTGPAEVTLLENERWASPVNDEIKDALRLELQRRLSRMTGSQPTFTKLRIEIDVQHLEAVFGRYALFEVSWSATSSAGDQRPGSARVITCTFRADENIPTGYGAIVEGYQRGIAALAATIAAVLTSHGSGIEAPCQKSIEGFAGGSGSMDQ